MSLFEIDLTNAQKNLPDYVRETKIKCTLGKYQTTFDVIECDFRKDVYEYFINRVHPAVGDGKNWPVGIDLETLPVGAIITKIK
jgi:hypothetical protein